MAAVTTNNVRWNNRAETWRLPYRGNRYGSSSLSRQEGWSTRRTLAPRPPARRGHRPASLLDGRHEEGPPVTRGSVLRPGQPPEIVEEHAIAAVGGGTAVQVELVGGGRLSQERDASDASRRNGRGIKGQFGPLIVPHRVEPQVAHQAVEALAPEDNQAATGGIEESHGVVARCWQW